jgi:predicted nucleotidyltransferase
MLVGATARDLLLRHVHGHAVTRFTYDVDFAILVDSWKQFEAVKQALLRVPGVSDRGRFQHRPHYRAGSSDPENVIDIYLSGDWKMLKDELRGLRMLMS